MISISECQLLQIHLVLKGYTKLITSSGAFQRVTHTGTHAHTHTPTHTYNITFWAHGTASTQQYYVEIWTGMWAVWNSNRCYPKTYTQFRTKHYENISVKNYPVSIQCIVKAGVFIDTHSSIFLICPWRHLLWLLTGIALISISTITCFHGDKKINNSKIYGLFAVVDWNTFLSP